MAEGANFKRGDRAITALAAAAYRKSEKADLVADLLHLAQREGEDVEVLLARGLTHYGADCVEQAWQASDDWADELQDEANASRALMVCIACGVPAQFHYDVLVYVGIARRDD